MSESQKLMTLAAKIVDAVDGFDADPMVMGAALKIAAKPYEEAVTAQAALAMMKMSLDHLGRT